MATFHVIESIVYKVEASDPQEAYDLYAAARIDNTAEKEFTAEVERVDVYDDRGTWHSHKQ